MVAAETTTKILQALLETHPTDGQGVITGLDIQQGWGDMVQVHIYAGRDRRSGEVAEPAVLERIRRAVVGSLGDDVRHTVRIVNRDGGRL